MSLIEVTDATFEEVVLQSPVPVLVDFYSVQCGPCRRMVPVLEGLAQELGDRARVVKVNAPENPALAVDYHVTVVPTLVVFKGGIEVNRLVGVASTQRLLDALGIDR
jgi:thioredoxin 1